MVGYREPWRQCRVPRSARNHFPARRICPRPRRHHLARCLSCSFTSVHPPPMNRIPLPPNDTPTLQPRLNSGGVHLSFICSRSILSHSLATLRSHLMPTPPVLLSYINHMPFPYLGLIFFTFSAALPSYCCSHTSAALDTERVYHYHSQCILSQEYSTRNKLLQLIVGDVMCWWDRWFVDDNARYCPRQCLHL